MPPRIRCDGDGWVVRANKELDYPHHLHTLDHTKVSGLKITGDVSVSFVGIVSKGASSIVSDLSQT